MRCSPVRCAGTGAGTDTREQQFYDALLGATDMDTVLRQLTQRGIRSGEQRGDSLVGAFTGISGRVVFLKRGSQSQ